MFVASLFFTVEILLERKGECYTKFVVAFCLKSKLARMILVVSRLHLGGVKFKFYKNA